MGSMSEVLEPGPVPAMEQLLDDFVRSHPQLAWLPQMLAARRASVPDEPLPDTRQDEFDALQLELAQAQRHAARMERIARRVSGELEAARDRLSDLAVAFGACGLCWGVDPQCPGCRGRGGPGRFSPDPELLSRLGVAAARRPRGADDDPAQSAPPAAAP